MQYVALYYWKYTQYDQIMYVQRIMLCAGVGVPVHTSQHRY